MWRGAFETPYLSGEAYQSYSVIRHINTPTLHANGPELEQLLAPWTCTTIAEKEPGGKLSPQISRAARGQRGRKRPRSDSRPDTGLSLRKRQVTMHYIHIGAQPRALHCEYHLSILTSQWQRDSINNIISVTVGQKGRLVVDFIRVFQSVFPRVDW